LPVLSRHANNVRRKRERRHSSKHFKPRRQSKTKRYSILKIFEVEGVAVEVEEMVTVVEVVVKKGIMRRMGNQANKIGVEEDAVVGEVADQIILISSATNATNMVTMRRIVTPISVTIVARWDISQKNIESIKKWKRTNLATEDEVKEGFLLMAHNEVDTDNNTVWYLDSGASNHM
jgi:hypothetical protein